MRRRFGEADMVHGDCLNSDGNRVFGRTRYPHPGQDSPELALVAHAEVQKGILDDLSRLGNVADASVDDLASTCLDLECGFESLPRAEELTMGKPGF